MTHLIGRDRGQAATLTWF